MACMTHFCFDCKHEWFNNQTSAICPKCLSKRVTHDFDEEPEEHDGHEEDQFNIY